MQGTKRILILAALPLIAIACGLPQSSEFEQIGGDEVQFGLDQAAGRHRSLHAGKNKRRALGPPLGLRCSCSTT